MQCGSPPLLHPEAQQSGKLALICHSRLRSKWRGDCNIWPTDLAPLTVFPAPTNFHVQWLGCSVTRVPPSHPQAAGFGPALSSISQKSPFLPV